MDAIELVKEYFSRTNTYRTDLNALAESVEARASGDVIDSMKLVNLFWEAWRPSQAYHLDTKARMTRTEPNPPPLPDDIEAVFLEELARLERECRIPYVPDSEEPTGSELAYQYIHVGAASALRHMRRDNYSDDVIQALEEVNSILRHSQLTFSWDKLLEHGLPGANAFAVSQFGVWSLILSALASIKHIDREYGEAFEMAVEALALGQCVSEDSSLINYDYDIDELIKELGENSAGKEAEEKIRTNLEFHFNPLDLLKPQGVVDTFEELKRRGQSEDWSRVAFGCRLLALADSFDLNGTEVIP